MNSFPFTSQDGDRKVKTSDFRELFKKYFTNGVFNGTFNVVQSTGMKVILKKGWCNIEGCFGWTDEDIELTIESVSQETTHNIVLRLDDNREVRTINAYVVKGNPSAVEPTRTQTVYELVVARIKTNVTTTSIQQSMIEDTRLDTNLCGIVSSTVETIDTTTFYEQIQGDLQEFKDNEQVSFDEWFESIKDQLSTDVAGNLQNQIDDINAKKTSLTDANNNPIVTAPMIAPVNRLVNGDFQIWQRGSTFTLSHDERTEYVADMWFVWNGQGIIEKKQGGGLISRQANTISQIIELEEGKTYTLYFNVNGIELIKHIIAGQDSGDARYTFYKRTNGDYLIGIKLDNETLNWACLFEGDIAYPHVKEDKSVALLRCKNYVKLIN